jgi:transposase
VAYEVVVEHLNHLGIVAEVCEEIGVAEWLDAQASTSRQQVSVGTATVAMVLNGLGLSNRQLYLVSQFFADKPVEHLLGPGITAADLNDDCLGRTLDWLYAHDVTTLFAGLALRARRAFGIPLTHLHADTTSFSVSGEYRPPEEGELDAHTIAVTYGYSRDHREDLKQWMLALITSGEGVPHFLKPLNGNASDKASLPHVVGDLTRHLRESGETAGVYVADSGLYSEANLRALNAAEVAWVSRVPETSTVAQAVVREEPASWQQSEEGQLWWWSRTHELPHGREGWLVIRSREGEQRARATLQRQAAREQVRWEKRMWHLGNRNFACEADAQAAFERDSRPAPSWLRATARVVVVPKYGRVGRPRPQTAPLAQEWHVQVTLTRDPAALEREALRRAAFIVATNVLDPEQLPDQELIATYKAQSAVERGFAFLKDPLFLASSVFVKKPHRIMALAFLMVVCLLVYRLAEVRVRERLTATQETVPDQLRRPTARPTMRWLFQCFEGIDLHHMTLPEGLRTTQVLRLNAVHRLVLRLLGPAYEDRYLLSSETAK